VTIIVAVLAALWLNTSQALELSHLHGWDDSYEQCLSCHGDKTTPISVPYHYTLGRKEQSSDSLLNTRQAYRQYPSLPPLRGPPAHT
jgi:hypothetical protein